MTIEDPDCASIDAGPRSLRFRLPAGAVIEAIPAVPAVVPPDPFTLAAAGLAQASGAMAPLSPFFRMLDAILAIKRFVEAVKDNPFSVADAASDVLETVDALASVVPQVSVPLLARDLVAAVDLMLVGVLAQIDGLIAQQARIEEARALITTIPAMASAVECADEQMAGMCANLDLALAPARGILTLLGVLLAPAGLGSAPTLEPIGSDPAQLEAARTSIARSRQLLSIFLSAIPG